MARKSAKRLRKPFDFSVMDTLPIPPEREPYEETKDYALEMQKNRRNTLIEKVERGLLTPEQAEEQALEQRIGPLASRLGDLTTLTGDMMFWTLEMVAAWTDTTRTDEERIKAVHRHYRPSYVSKYIWTKTNRYYSPVTGRTYWGWNEEKPADAIQCHGLHELADTYFDDGYVDFDGEHARFPRLETFLPQLRIYLLHGQIIATGEVASSLLYQRCTIKPDDWECATFEFDGDNGPCLRINDKIIYRKLLFRASEILTLYPTQATTLRYQCRIYRWKSDIEFKEDYKTTIVKHLKTIYPRGIPDWRPKKIRYLMLMDALGLKLAFRWWTPPGAKDAAKKAEAFRTAIDRILDGAIERAPTVFNDIG